MKLEIKNPIGRAFIPNYNELSLFLMSFSFVLVFVTQESLRTELHDLFVRDLDINTIVAIPLLVSGIIYSFVSVFIDRDKSKFEKSAMLGFAILLNVYCGIEASSHIIKESNGFMLVFPIWNLSNAVLLFLLFKSNLITHENISNEKYNRFQVFFGLLIILFCFLISDKYFHFYWAVTLSMCVSYSTSINDFVWNAFFNPSNETKENFSTIIQQSQETVSGTVVLKECHVCHKKFPENKGRMTLFPPTEFNKKFTLSSNIENAIEGFICNKCSRRSSVFVGVVVGIFIATIVSLIVLDNLN